MKHNTDFVKKVVIVHRGKYNNKSVNRLSDDVVT